MRVVVSKNSDNICRCHQLLFAKKFPDCIYELFPDYFFVVFFQFDNGIVFDKAFYGMTISDSSQLEVFYCLCT